MNALGVLTDSEFDAQKQKFVIGNRLPKNTSWKPAVSYWDEMI